MSAGSGSSTARVTLIRILADSTQAVNALKDLASRLTHTTKAYLYLKHVLMNMIKAFDEIDSVVRRSSDVYLRQGIVLNDIIDRYGTLSSGLAGAVATYQQLIRTQGMTEASMVKLAVQSRQLSSILNRAVEDIAKTMRQLKTDLGLTNSELERMNSAMGAIAYRTGAAMESMAHFATQGGALAKMFGGTKENAMALAAAFENATGSTANANAMFDMFMRDLQSYGKEFAGLPAFFHQASQAMLSDPVKALGILQQGMSNVSAEQRRMIVSTGKLNAVQIEWLNTLGKQAGALNASLQAQQDAADGTVTLASLYDKIIGGIGEQMKRLVEDLKAFARGFGSILNPVIATMIALFRGFLYVLNALPTPVKGVIGLIGGMTLAFVAVNHAIAALGRHAAGIIPPLENLGKEFTSLTIRANTFATMLGTRVKSVSGQALGWLGGLSMSIRGLFSGGLWAGIVAGFTALWAKMGAAVIAVKAAIAAGTAGLAGFAAAALPVIAIGLAIVGVFLGIAKALGGVGNILITLKGWWNSFYAGVKDSMKGMGDAFTILFAAFKNLFSITDAGKGKTEEFSRTMFYFGKVAGVVLKSVAYLVYGIVWAVGLAIAIFSDLTSAVIYVFKLLGGLGASIGGALIGAVGTAAKYVSGLVYKAAEYLYDAIVGKAKAAIATVTDLYEKFLEWLGRGKTAQDYEKTDEYAAAKKRALAAADAYSRQQAAIHGVTGAMDKAANAAENLNRNTIDSNKSLAVMLEKQRAMNEAAEKDIQTGIVITEKRRTQVEPGRAVAQPAFRHMAMSMTTPYSAPQSPNQTVESQGRPAGGDRGTISVPVQIVLDEYVLGQALVKIDRNNNILNYGEPSGPLHGIR